ncbi:MAG TPA: MBL fold metallo-hydrolase [Actinomycetota bacterium]|jgi:phosphoribosyl 1,2-cyclic phosphodiesterase
MKARIWGCRGSLAAPGPETVRYGGNTSCVEVRLSDDRLLVIDAGTGIRGLGLHMGAERPSRIDVLLTHLHLDHIEGLGFFTPIWDPECEIHLWGPPAPPHSLRDRIITYFSPPLFPIHLQDVPANLVLHDVPQEEWELGSARIYAERVNHPGPTMGYRIDEAGSVLTYISDHEPALNVDLALADPPTVSGYNLALGADVLFHDAQYTEEEYPGRKGWGHSAISHTVAFGHMAKVRRLLMFHHDPLHSDAMLEAMLLRARELWGSEREGLVLCAYEGMELNVG